MNMSSIFVTPVSDCSPTPRRANIVRVAIVRSFKNGESTVSGRPFKSFADLRKELIRTNLLDSRDLSDLEQNVSKDLSWLSPNAVAITDEQVKQMKLQPVGCAAPTPTSH